MCRCAACIRIAALVLVAIGWATAPLGTRRRRRRARSSCARVWSRALRHEVRTLVYLPPSYRPDGPPLPTLYLLHGTPGTPDSLFALGRAGAARQADRERRRAGDDRRGAERRAAAGERHGVGRLGRRRGSALGHVRDARPRQRHRQRLPDQARPSLARDRRNLDGRLRRDQPRARSLRTGSASRPAGRATSSPIPPTSTGPRARATWRARSPLLSVAQRAPTLRRRPVATSFYSGRADRFFAENVSFSETLTRLGIPHRFRAVAGGHDASVWRAQLTTELAWIGQEFQRASA